MEMVSPKGNRESYWRGIISGHPGSGLSIVAYCRREGVSEACFYQWRNRLGLPRSSHGRHPRVPPRPVNLVPVRVLPPAGFSDHPISVELPNGIRLRVPDLSTAVDAVRLLAGEPGA